MLDCLKKTKWMGLFTRTYTDKKGKLRYWDFCSRKDNPDEETDRADAVCVVPFLEDGRIVVIKQFRPALNDYVIETVAGLHDQEDILATAEKELLEEVGLTVRKRNVNDNILYNSVGITDESCSYVFCTAEGEPNTYSNEDSEDIEVLVLDRFQAELLCMGDLCEGENTTKISAKCWLILLAYANGFDWMSV